MTFHKHLFIGVLIVFIDINIEWFDILPDVIGYVFIFNAFLKVTKPYAALGLVTTVILLGHSIVAFFSPSDLMLLFSEEILHYNFTQQIFQLVVGVTSIVNYACMFAVSNAIMPITNKKLPGIFITLLLLFELALSFVYYLTPNELLLVLLPLSIIIFITYIVFLVFLWKRSKVEPSKVRPSGELSFDEAADDLI
jgi:hypothetical protein